MPTHRQLPRPHPNATCYQTHLEDQDRTIVIAHETVRGDPVCIRCGTRLSRPATSG